MAPTDRDPWLLTPGPLTTSVATKEAMLHDWGSRDEEFINTDERVRNRLLDIAEAVETHVCVPIQGSGTFTVEGTIGTLLPREGKALVLINGAYGKRIVRIIDYLGRDCVSLET
ncbi:MAG: 2-aminoethylphosphonate--pyruvate transaminase, partial [Alphaproteobacteria bacterium MarineAlpha3_Bin4]